MEQPAIKANTPTVPFLNKLRENLLRWVRLTNKPVVKLYHGYGNEDEIVVLGHVLQLSPLPRKKYRRNVWTNTFALIRLFMVKPLRGVRVRLTFEGETIETVSEADGFFRVQWKPVRMPPAGWYLVKAILAEGMVKQFYGTVSSEGSIYIPHTNQYAIISDIDDTFLISYSSNLWKRLYVMLTENAWSRKPFEGVVKHYQALGLAGTAVEEPNPFFYVSSSEWNLYDYISEFSRKNKLPKGIYLLSQIKRLSEAWKTGRNNHATKFVRISRVLQAFPSHRFILLGDDSQQDPFIYASVVQHFGQQIRAVYLRNVFTKNEVLVKEAIEKITAAGISVCHFEHSQEALDHSKKIGLI